MSALDASPDMDAVQLKRAVCLKATVIDITIAGACGHSTEFAQDGH